MRAQSERRIFPGKSSRSLAFRSYRESNRKTALAMRRPARSTDGYSSGDQGGFCTSNARCFTDIGKTCQRAWTDFFRNRKNKEKLGRGPGPSSFLRKRLNPFYFRAFHQPHALANADSSHAFIANHLTQPRRCNADDRCGFPDSVVFALQLN